MPEHTRCAARLRSGERCRSVAVEGDFCAHHAARAAEVGEGRLREGRHPPRRRQGPALVRGVTELEQNETPRAFASNGSGMVTPSDVRPHLAEVAAANLSEIERVLIETATGANRQVWVTINCKHCERPGRYEVDIPDNRVRLDAVEKLLQQGLGRAREAEQSQAPQMPTSVAAVQKMSWEEMQAVFAVVYVDELADVQRRGGEALLRERIAKLSEGERSILCDALAC
jgi:hypothetical protein